MQNRETAKVIAAPPILFAGALALGLLLNAFHRVAIMPGIRVWRIVTAAVLIAFGLVLSSAVVLTFRRAATPVSPRKKTMRLVCGGPYRYTRNPDYIGQLALYIGIALALNSLWLLIWFPLLVALIHWGVALREERYLESKFGQEYREYKARVRRWL